MKKKLISLLMSSSIIASSSVFFAACSANKVVSLDKATINSNVVLQMQGNLSSALNSDAIKDLVVENKEVVFSNIDNVSNRDLHAAIEIKNIHEVSSDLVEFELYYKNEFLGKMRISNSKDSTFGFATESSFAFGSTSLTPSKVSADWLKNKVIEKQEEIFVNIPDGFALNSNLKITNIKVSDSSGTISFEATVTYDTNKTINSTLTFTNFKTVDVNAAVITSITGSVFDTTANIQVRGRNLKSNYKYQILNADGTALVVSNLAVESGSTESLLKLSFNSDQLYDKMQIRLSVNGGEKSVLSDKLLLSKNTNSDFVNQQSSQYSSMTKYVSKTIGYKSRVVNNSFYETELQRQYGSQGFRYPGYDYNYKENNNRYLKLSNGNSIDMSDLVFNEKVPNTDKRYSDASFLTEEINNNRLKKHPAAEKFYIQNVLDTTLSVTKSFSIGSDMLGVSALGLYAPAGEVITLTFDDKTFDLIQRNNFSDFEIIINDNYWDNKAAPDSGQISDRYPFVRSFFKIDPKSKTVRFGSPFGGSITISINKHLKYDNASDIFDNRGANVDFNFVIEGAVEQVHYAHGQTSEDDWNTQLQKVKNKQITAPIFSAIYDFASINAPFTGINEIAYVKLDDIVYPKAVFDKWHDFTYMSSYFSGNDLKNPTRRCSFKFCNDIWGGAAAWGGSWTLWAKVNQAGNAFLKGTENFTINKQWVMLHEINHSFEQNAAIFTNRTHGGTNQVTITNLATIGDFTRFRNRYNFNGEWTDAWWSRLANQFSIIDRSNKDNSTDEYGAYALLLYTMGVKQITEYVRQDVIYHPNVGGLEEIERLSDYLQLNLYPAFNDISNYWNWHDNNWPTKNQESAKEKQIINSLNKYPAIDFVGNLYAAGAYIYNMQQNDFVYTGDTNSVYEIPAGKQYEFDLEKFINSNNPNFSWSKLEFNSVTKNNGKLSVDPNNPKKLIYQPDKNSITDIDEFDVTIYPDQFSNKPQNYVAAYKWKIKVRQVVNQAIHYVYPQFDSHRISFSDAMKAIENMQPIYTYTNPIDYVLGFDGTGRSITKTVFKFVAPETGTYDIDIKWDDHVLLRIDGKVTFRKEGDAKKYEKVGSFNFTKGQVVEFDAIVMNTGGVGGLGLQVSHNGNQIDINDNILVPYINEIGTNYSDYLTNDDYKYKPRQLDYSQYSNLSSIYSNNLSTNTFIDKNKYQLSSTYNGVQNLKEDNNSIFEVKNSNDDSTSVTVDFTTTFADPTKVGSIYIGHDKNNNAKNDRPTHVVVKGYDEKDREFTIYDGKYAAWYNDRDKDYSVIVFDKQYTVKKITVVMTNENTHALSLRHVLFSNNIYAAASNKFAVNNNYIQYFGNWTFVRNNDEIESKINNLSVVSNKKSEYFEFNLTAQEFEIFGTKTTSNALFDVYINDVLVQANVSTKSDTTLNNQSLFRYTSNSGYAQNMKIKIVHKDNNPLIINYINTFGVNTKLF